MSQVEPGLYQKLVTESLARQLDAIDPRLLRRGRLDPSDAHEALARHLAALTRQALRRVGTKTGSQQLARQITLANRLAAAIAELVDDESLADPIVTSADEILSAVAAKIGPGGRASWPDRPETPLDVSALLVNTSGGPSVGSEVRKELHSADHVYLICAFITWPGVRIFEDRIRDLANRGGQFRVITTTYMGATEKRAIDKLIEMGAKVKISYDSRSTRLHAKAWLFRRNSGFHTAYVGSSNLSRPAQTTGLEWNVRLSVVEQPHLLDTFEAAFEEYWESPEFVDYRPEQDGRQLEEALRNARGKESAGNAGISPLEVWPYGYQQEILDELDAERKVHGRWHNLVVMATGTGKTVVAGLDFKRLRRAGRVESLLFIAHREEILSESLRSFRQIVRDGSFGELFVNGAKPQRWQHVFASIQSLGNLDLDPAQFDMVIVDEFHHAAASTYTRLLNRLRPKVLLGLTATPERTDGQDVRSFFDGRISVELRLWEALERGLLAPFQYFGISDETDLSAIRFRRRTGYDLARLSNVYSGNDARVRLIQQAVQDKIAYPRRMRAVGFCVSIEHANFMAQRFNEAGIPSASITSATAEADRKGALTALRERRVNCLFTVDLFNEGVNLPEIDTVLLLRPTESATIFLQQIGRGLRLADEKPCLTVLDFIGVQAKGFRFDLRYRSLSGVSRQGLVREIEHGFPTLPAGCHVSLDPVAAQNVLQNIRESLSLNWRGLVAEVMTVAKGDDLTLNQFLDNTGVEPEDIYRPGKGGWPQLKRDAGLMVPDPANLETDVKLSRAIGRLLHTDDPERLLLWQRLRHVEEMSPRELRLAQMLHVCLLGGEADADDTGSVLAGLRSEESRVSELAELGSVLHERIRRVTQPLEPSGPNPLHLHARYTRWEALAAFGTMPGSFREGVKWIAEANADVFFVTLTKTEQKFSPTTRYADHAITPNLFQWESQSTTSETSKTGRRYVNHESMGSSVHLFLRVDSESDGNLGVPAFFYAGPMTYVNHEGSRPIRFTWRLHHALPADVFHAAKVTTG
jgi:superfamily II DNA or RNA helicase